ncbi:hypothetical protein Q8A73_006351 [Channa argus]|nr:hypothetical protein Q8A73_006351 [Channa argus]
MRRWIKKRRCRGKRLGEGGGGAVTQAGRASEWTAVWLLGRLPAESNTHTLTHTGFHKLPTYLHCHHTQPAGLPQSFQLWRGMCHGVGYCVMELAVQEASIDNYTLSRSGWLQRDRPLRCPMQLKLESRSPFISSHRSTVFPPHGVSVRGASQLQHISNTVPHAARLGSPTSSRSELQIKKRMEERKRPAYHRLWKLAPPHSHRTFARTLLTLPPYLSWDCGSPRGTYPVMLLNIPVKKLRPSRYHPQQQRRTDTE